MLFHMLGERRYRYRHRRRWLHTSTCDDAAPEWYFEIVSLLILRRGGYFKSILQYSGVSLFSRRSSVKRPAADGSVASVSARPWRTSSSSICDFPSVTMAWIALTHGFISKLYSASHSERAYSPASPCHRAIACGIVINNDAAAELKHASGTFSARHYIVHLVIA